MKLENYLPSDSNPWSGVKEINPPIMVKMCDLPDTCFSKTSILGDSKDEYYKSMRAVGVRLGKSYKAIRVEGFGDVADITIINDFGEEDSFMDVVFEDAEE